jgi:uncharacterized protein YqhQ
VFFSYIFIYHLDDIRRVFQYHGAEHKTVYTFQALKPDGRERAEESTLHPDAARAS